MPVRKFPADNIARISSIPPIMPIGERKPATGRTYLYNFGLGADLWENGYAREPEGEFIPVADYAAQWGIGDYTGNPEIFTIPCMAILTKHTTDKQNDWSAVTRQTIDLSPYSNLRMIASQTGSGSAPGPSIYFVVSSEKNGAYNGAYEARTIINQNYGFRRFNIDISALTGSSYIRIHAVDSNSSYCYPSHAWVLAVWLE